MTGRFFEDFKLDEVIVHATPRTISSGDAALYLALTGSRQPLHCAETVARACGFEQIPLDPLLVFHIAFGKTVNDISLNAVANLGYADLRFLAPVYSGDTLSVQSRVIGLKENSSKQSGIVYVHSSADSQHGTTVLEWKRWVMVRKRDEATLCHEMRIPELPAEVPLSRFRIPAMLRRPEYAARFSGSDKFASQYQPGETIAHGGGITIGESDHMLATRLYQNNARVHFDAAYMRSQGQGQRLVYGGHIMSLVRAMSHQGLENALWLCAFHGGTHAHPSFAGDTIYAASVVQSITPVNAHFSALRIVSCGLKQEADACYLAELPELTSAKSLPESVVLRWDYSVLMPV